jgi:hypothetical protein
MEVSSTASVPRGEALTADSSTHQNGPQTSQRPGRDPAESEVRDNVNQEHGALSKQREALSRASRPLIGRPRYSS